MTWIQSAWSFEKTHIQYPLNSSTWTDLTYLSGGSRLVCENHSYILVIAKSTTDADTAFAAGNFEVVAAGAERIIPTRQEKQNNDNGWRFYAKCEDDDELTATLAVVAVVDEGVVPEKVTFETGAPHGFSAGDYVTIGTIKGSTEYAGSFLITAVTATTFTIWHAYIAITPAGTETVNVYPTVLSRIGMP